MKNLLVILLLVCYIGCSRASTPPEVVADRPFVYNLIIDEEPICTAFAAQTEKGVFAITAGHCSTDLQAGKTGELFDSLTNKKFKVKLKMSVLDWPNADFGVWEFDGDKPKKGLAVTSKVPEDGEDVWTFTSPLGMTPMLVHGIYSGITGCADNHEAICQLSGLHATTFVVNRGSSGSPAIDSKGRVWGIVVGGNPELIGMAHVVKVPDSSKWVW